MPKDEALPIFPPNATGNDETQMLIKKYHKYYHQVYKDGKAISMEIKGLPYFSQGFRNLETIYTKNKISGEELEEYDYEQFYVYAIRPKSN